MGVVAWTVLAGVTAGLSAAAPWMVYADRIVPALRQGSVRAPAYWLATVPAAVASALTLARLIGFTTGSLANDVVVIAATIGVACSWGPIIRVVRALVRSDPSLGTPRPVDGVRTVGAIPLAGGARVLGYALGIGMFMVTMTAFAVPAAASFTACLDTEQLLADAEPAPPNTAPMQDAFSYNPPELGAQFLIDTPMSLDFVASSKSDPNTRDQLVAAGFVGAYVRNWIGADGSGIEVEVMEFATPEGAAEYHGLSHRYACGYANEAFAAPMGGIGLQVRYETGAPYVEQVAWIAGDRRYKVQVSAWDRPSDHDRVLRLLAATTAGWPPAAAPSVEPTPSPSPMEPASDEAIEEIRAAVEATRAEGSVWINRRAEYFGSSEIPDETTATVGGQVGFGETRRMRVGVRSAEDPSDLEASSLEVILDGELIYVRGRALEPHVPDGEWLVTDLTSDDPRAEPIIELVSGHNDPAMSFYFLFGVTHVLGQSEDVVHEQRARHYTVQVDLEAAEDALPAELRSAFRTNVDAMREAGFRTNFQAEVWVAEDGLVHFIRYAQEFDEQAGGGSMTATVDLFDFGLPLGLDLPPPEHVNPIEDVKVPGPVLP